MYHIEHNGAVIGDYEVVLWIKKHTNGCYVPCPEDEAEGVCVKVPHRARAVVLDENGAEIGEETFTTTLTDMVYRTVAEGLNGTEPLVEVSVVEGYTTVAEQKAAAYDILMGVAE